MRVWRGANDLLLKNYQPSFKLVKFSLKNLILNLFDLTPQLLCSLRCFIILHLNFSVPGTGVVYCFFVLFLASEKYKYQNLFEGLFYNTQILFKKSSNFETEYCFLDKNHKWETVKSKDSFSENNLLASFEYTWQPTWTNRFKCLG